MLLLPIIEADGHYSPTSESVRVIVVIFLIGLRSKFADADSAKGAHVT